MALLRLGRHVRRRQVIRRQILGVALGDLPVLAILAVQVAPDGGQRKALGAGKEVEKWLFLDGIHMNRAGAAVGDGLQLTVHIHADSAVAALTGLNQAGTGADAALHRLRRLVIHLASPFPAGPAGCTTPRMASRCLM